MLTRQTSQDQTPLATAALALLALVAAACQSGSGPRQRPTPSALLEQPHPVVVDWSNNAYDAFVADDKYGNPLEAVRVMAMAHLAQHDALAAIRPTFAPYALQESAPEADPVAAAASAAFEVLAAEIPGQRTLLQARLAESVKSVADAKSRDAGLALGKRAATAVLQRRQGDGSDTTVMVPLGSEPTKPGVYRAVAPFDFVFAPGWNKLKPFALQNPQQFRVPAPPTLDSAAYTAAFDEVKRVGRKGSTARSADETAYAKFWYEFSDIGWNRIARVVATEHKLGLQASARLFALLNMALSDAYVAGWDSKVHYDFWRPTTAIRAAAIDGNDQTTPDATWESEEITPPVHDYPSTHSALGNAGAEVLAHVFGDRTPFSFTSTSAPGTSRRFETFSQAADENAQSRLKGGLHFRFSCEAGQALGKQVGSWVAATSLRPMGTVASAR